MTLVMEMDTLKIVKLVIHLATKTVEKLVPLEVKTLVALKELCEVYL